MDKLINAATEMAVRLLEEFEEFYPLAFGLTDNHEAVNIATMTDTDFPTSQQVIAELKKALVQAHKTGPLIATCLCLDVFYTPPASGLKTDALQLLINFIDKPPSGYLIPYSIDKGQTLLDNSVPCHCDTYMNFGTM